MKLLTQTFTTLIAILVFTSCSKDEEFLSESINEVEISANLIVEDQFASEILIEINAYRSTLSLPALKDNTDPEVKAVEHTKYMASKNVISHDNFYERSDYLKSKGAGRVSENVAFGYRTAKEVVAAWIKSDSHRKSIEGDFSHSGIAVVKNEKGVAYFTQIFIKK